MIIHLVYPVDFKKISAPWSMGNNLYKHLSKWHKVIIYQWTSYEKILPKKGDILIGHAHPNPMTCFRRSLDNVNWAKKIILQPFNSDKLQASYIYKIINKVDLFIAITGDYWFKYIDKTIFKKWKKKMQKVDMAIDRKHYPQVKKKMNEIGKRKFLYIGNDYKFNNYSKNTNFLQNIISNYDKGYFGCMGNKNFIGALNYGWADFKKKKFKQIISKYDFLIMTSNYDANPTTILEAMSWGLIPVVTKECGYFEHKGIINIPLNNLKKTINILNNLQNINEQKLLKLSKANIQNLKKKYSWNNINKIIRKNILSQKKYKNIFFNQKEIKKFNFYEKKSPNYPLKIGNIYAFLKTSLKYFLLKICLNYKK